MKKLLAAIGIITLIISVMLLTACDTNTPTPILETTLTPEKIIDPIDPGLFKVKINDSTTILIYRGTESCTMIKL